MKVPRSRSNVTPLRGGPSETDLMMALAVMDKHGMVKDPNNAPPPTAPEAEPPTGGSLGGAA